MTTFRSNAGETPYIPDNVTVPQFFLDSLHPRRPERPESVPWLVVDKTGRKIFLEEIQRRTSALVTSLRDRYALREDDVVTLFSTNHVDYLTSVWAVHRLLGIVAPCNPMLTSSELTHHLKQSRSTLIIAHQDSLDTVLTALPEADISIDRVIVLTKQEDPQSKSTAASRLNLSSIEELIQDGLKALPLTFPGRKLSPGEGQKKVALYISSSGTTGRPKMVKISHYSFIADVLLIASMAKVHENYAPREKRRYRPGDACLAILPFYHIYGLSFLAHFNLFSGISVVVVPKFNFTEMLRSIVRHKITTLLLVPPQVVLLCKDPSVQSFDLSSVRTVMCSAAPLSPELHEQLHERLPQVSIGQGYGSTESGGIVSMTPADHLTGRHGGMLAPGVEARVVKPDGTLGRKNEVGELYIKTPAVAMGYLDNETASKEVFLPDGWVRMGDQVVINDNDEIVVLDRMKEMIKVRGFQVAPAELEGCILDHPYAADACVVGVPDLYNGEVPFAFVRLTKEGQQAVEAEGHFDGVRLAIQKHIEKQKAQFKRVRQVEIIDLIPKTPSGKLLRRELRERAMKLARETAKL